MAFSRDPSLPITALNEGAWGNLITVRIDDPSDRYLAHFKLSVIYGDRQVETYDNLCSLADRVNPADPPPSTYAISFVNSRSDFIGLGVNPDNSTVDLAARPHNGTITLVGGRDGVSPTVVDYTGIEAASSDVTGTGLRALDKITDVNLIGIPGQGNPGVVSQGMGYCKNIRPLQDAFFIGDTGTIADVNQARSDGAQPDVRIVADARDLTAPSLDKRRRSAR